MAGLGEGGGGASGSIRAGRAFVEAGVDDRGISTGLRRLEKRFSDFGERLKKMPIVGGFAGGVGASVFENIKEAGAKALDKAIGGDQFKKSMEAAAKAAGELADKTAEVAANVKEWLPAVSSGRGIELLTESIREQTGALDELERKREKIAKTKEGLEENSIGNLLVTAFRPELLERDVDATTNALKEIDEAIKRTKAGITEAEKLRGRAIDPTRDPAFVGRVKELKEAMEFAPKLDGLEGFVRQVTELETKFGGKNTKKVFEDLFAGAKDADAAQKIRDATKSLKEYVAGVEKAQREAGKSAHEIALMNAEAAKVPKAAIDDARASLLGRGGILGRALGKLVSPDLLRELAAIGELKTSARGAFSTPFAAQQFAPDSMRRLERPLNQIATNTKKTAESTAELRDRLSFK